MVTTRRSTDSRSTYERNSSSARVDLLERTVSVSYDDYLVNMPAEEINTALKALVPKARVSYLLNSVEFLRRGGRCSALCGSRRRDRDSSQGIHLPLCGYL